VDWGPGPEHRGKTFRAHLLFDTGPFKLEGDTVIEFEAE